MELNINQQDLSRRDLTLGEPHFVDEATLLSARQVVPLDVVQAKRTGKRLAFALAISVVLLIGAFGATLVYKLSGRERATNITEIDSLPQQSGPPVEAEVTAVESREPETTIRQQEGPAVVEDTGAKAPRVISRGPQARVSRKIIKSARPDETRQNKIADQGQFEKEMRRAERREARRLRQAERSARREGGGRKRRSSDLSRIREIFEGPTRP